MAIKHAKRTRKGRGFDVNVCGRFLCPDLKAKTEAKTREIALELMGARICNTLTLKISLVATVVNGEEYTGAVWTGCDGSKTDKTAYPIAIQRDRPWRETVRTLAHELCHVEQARRGRLQYRIWATDRQVHVRWDGVEVGSLRSIPYHTRPWEVEAREVGERFSK